MHVHMDVPYGVNGLCRNWNGGKADRGPLKAWNPDLPGTNGDFDDIRRISDMKRDAQ